MNIAEKIRQYIGFDEQYVPHNRNYSSTKKGPGRVRRIGDGSKTPQQRQAGAFGRGLRKNITRKQLRAITA